MPAQPIFHQIFIEGSIQSKDMYAKGKSTGRAATALTQHAGFRILMDSVQGKTTFFFNAVRTFGGPEIFLSLPQQFHNCTHPDKVFVNTNIHDP
ncbi:uncharacterized protein FTOL_03173 [Fusarium torulosum]|uniref:Uncharacterized protein n=1 Tax=Fusarium torulosum TaxID=33205 RepID=A0AAE8M3D9_9HYPO|nr:uncharacterized protein FTOL_03173 [Fusarium torulosum]